MTTGIRLRVVQAPDDVHRAFARWVADFITQRNAAGLPTRLILPVGPTLGYPLLSELTSQERISWKRVQIITMDEYLDDWGRPLDPAHPLSFTGFMLRFLGSLDEDLRPPADAFVWPDPFEIDRVPRFIDRIGGIDACLGGVGVHGHVAFNEPPNGRLTATTIERFRQAPTRVVALAPETLVMNATRSQGGRFDDFPTMAVTIGMREILAADRIRLFCDGGTWQQEALRQAVEGDISVRYPVTLLQEHGDVEIVADQLTAASAAPSPTVI